METLCPENNFSSICSFNNVSVQAKKFVFLAISSICLSFEMMLKKQINKQKQIQTNQRNE